MNDFLPTLQRTLAWHGPTWTLTFSMGPECYCFRTPPTGMLGTTAGVQVVLKMAPGVLRAWQATGTTATYPSVVLIFMSFLYTSKQSSHRVVRLGSENNNMLLIVFRVALSDKGIKCRFNERVRWDCFNFVLFIFTI